MISKVFVSLKLHAFLKQPTATPSSTFSRFCFKAKNANKARGGKRELRSCEWPVNWLSSASHKLPSLRRLSWEQRSHLQGQKRSVSISLPFLSDGGFCADTCSLPGAGSSCGLARSRQHHPLSSASAPKCKLTLHSCFVLKGHALAHTFRLLSRSPSGLQSFFFPALLRYRWHETLCKFKVHNMIIWCTCILPVIPVIAPAGSSTWSRWGHWCLSTGHRGLPRGEKRKVEGEGAASRWKEA